MKLKGNIFFTSDTHYNHRNICRGVSRWGKGRSKEEFESSTRNFANLEEMNNEIVNSINSTVGVDDYLIHGGDWSFGGINSIWEFRSRINCKNIILITGNHDHHIKNNKLLPNVYWDWNGSGEYETGDAKANFKEDWDWNTLVTSSNVYANNLFTKVTPYLTLTANKVTFEICHFPLRVWDKAYHGRVHLFGHTHSNLDTGNERMLDIGIDNHFKLYGNYKPFTMSEIAEQMEGRTFRVKDHHNEKTK